MQHFKYHMHDLRSLFMTWLGAQQVEVAASVTCQFETRNGLAFLVFVHKPYFAADFVGTVTNANPQTQTIWAAFGDGHLVRAQTKAHNIMPGGAHFSFSRRISEALYSDAKHTKIFCLTVTSGLHAGTCCGTCK